MHDPAFRSRGVTLDFAENYFDPDLTSDVEGHCQVFLDVYPSSKFEESYESNIPAIFTAVVGVLFCVMAAAFFLYDWFVQTRNKKVVGIAARSNRVVSSLFPAAVRDRLLGNEKNKKGEKRDKNLRGFLSDRPETSNNILETPPIADFYPETTILFADLAGFTGKDCVFCMFLYLHMKKHANLIDSHVAIPLVLAWSSSRQPSEVFVLLETVYAAFGTYYK